MTCSYCFKIKNNLLFFSDVLCCYTLPPGVASFMILPMSVPGLPFHNDMFRVKSKLNFLK